MSHHVVARATSTGSTPVLSLLHGARSAFAPAFPQFRSLTTGSQRVGLQGFLFSKSLTPVRYINTSIPPSPTPSPLISSRRSLPSSRSTTFTATRTRDLQDRPRPSKYLSRTPFRSSLAGARGRRAFTVKRQKSSSNGPNSIPKPPPEPQKPSSPPSSSENSSRSFYSRLPQIPHYHRPTKEELLSAATGFWSRLKVRFKWFSIRSLRPFNNDEIGAIFSAVLFGHLLWIILGTTTFFSLAIFMINTVFAQETLARWVGNYLTKSSGVRVVFESAIVPKWGDGVITFKNVFISRRPGHGTSKVSKGSAETAAAAAAASAAASKRLEEEDTNYTQFDLTIDTVNVTLSFNKWFNGQGPLHDVEVKGVRGVVDRRSVHSTEEQVDPKSYRHNHNPGDFEIEHFKMDDFLVTVHQPGDFRPFPVSIFSCDLPRLRQQWLFYDFLCANTVSGSFDDSLFTIHPRQLIGHSRAQLPTDDGESQGPWQKQTRLRVDALKIDHLNRGTEGPFSWINEGAVDLVADVMFPADSDDSIISHLMSELKGVKALGERLTGDDTIENHDSTVQSKSGNLSQSTKTTDDKRFIVMDLRVNFHDVRAAVPLLSSDLSYVNNALIRPIVAYINSRKTFIPINCRVIKRVDDFDGSWTLFDSGLLDDLSAETYTAIVKDISDDRARMRRFKKVGLWSLQLAVQALFMGMAGNLA